MSIIPPPSLNVLLVEDDEDDYLLTRELLSELEGLPVALNWASSYQDGLAAMERRDHDVYLIDYQLGTRSGLELLRHAQSENCFSSPVIMLTGQESLDVSTEAIRAGASDYLLKSQVNAALLERSIRYAIERAKTLDVLHKLASYDELTGLYNRREMDRRLREGVNHYLRYNHPMALVMIDVDYFKIINDSYGHRAGDEVLRQLGALLRASVREVDLTARYGGEELAVILPNMTGQQAFGMAERLRRRISTHSFTLPQEKKQPAQLSITVSLGVAALPEDAVSAATLVEVADRRLYEAKRRGRNCTVQSHGSGGRCAASPEAGDLEDGLKREAP
jgi:diguanylate cyclase (GGDEF)-like protein